MYDIIVKKHEMWEHTRENLFSRENRVPKEKWDNIASQ